MTDTTENKTRWLPHLRSPWWTAVLGLSLMANLLVVGLVAGARFQGGPDRIQGASYVQLVPRSFFRDISKERRQALMDIVRSHRDDLRNLRKVADSASIKLADALEKEPFVLDDVQKTVAEFSTGTESLAAKGGDIVLQIVTALTPEERKQLATNIRNRAQRGKKKDGD